MVEAQAGPDAPRSAHWEPAADAQGFNLTHLGISVRQGQNIEVSGSPQARAIKLRLVGHVQARRRLRINASGRGRRANSQRRNGGREVKSLPEGRRSGDRVIVRQWGAIAGQLVDFLQRKALLELGEVHGRLPDQGIARGQYRRVASFDIEADNPFGRQLYGADQGRYVQGAKRNVVVQEGNERCTRGEITRLESGGPPVT